MQEKEYDLFMNMLRNPEASLDTFMLGGLNTDNTQLLDKSEYKSSNKIQEALKDQYGQFDEVKFDKLYNNAQMYYNILSQTDYDKIMKEQITYHRDDIFAPADQRRKGPDFQQVVVPNAYKYTSSIHELGKVGERTKSVDELAQSNKVLLNPTTAGENLENAQWGDSPNESFAEHFFDTLVLAEWDSDGTHKDPITGELVEHTKGDLKLDQTGNFYYEKLDGRDVYGRRVLNKMNVLTTDGSFWNRYDFFDSDDINQKSVGGSVLKNLALVGSMFIPYVGPWITVASIASQLAGLGATLGKMVSGSDNPMLSEIEGWSKSVSRQGAQTEYAQNNAWCWENFINLIGDVAGQLKEQRFIFEKIPYALSGTNIYSKESTAAKLASLEKKQQKLFETKVGDLDKITTKNLEGLSMSIQELRTRSALAAQAELNSFVKGYQKVGEILSKGYMTAITVGDTYGEAKRAGASDLEATLLTLGYAAGEYALLNTRVGEWILPELRAGRYKNQAIARAYANLNQENQNLYRQFGASLKNLSKEDKKSYVKNIFNIGRDIARAEYANGTKTLKASLAAGLGEGVEEVSEELLADFSKGCYDLVSWLRGNDTRLNAFGYNFDTQKFNLKDVVDRYSMSLVGGFVGGGLTNLGTNYSSINSLSNMTSEQAIQEMVYMARNGGLDKFLKDVNKMQLGDKNLSMETQKNEDGTISFKQADNQNNQDVYIKRAINQQAKFIQQILQANGATLSDESFLDKQTLGELRFTILHNSSMAGEILNEFNGLSSDIVKLTSQINTIYNKALDSNGDEAVSDREKRINSLSENDKVLVKKLEDELKDKQKSLKDLLEGKKSYEFISDALFEMTQALSGKLATTTLPLFAEQMFGKKYSELNENEKAVAYEKYSKWKNSEGREHIKTMSSIFRNISYKVSDLLEGSAKEYIKMNPYLRSVTTLINSLYNNPENREEDWLQKAQDIITTKRDIENIQFSKLLFGDQDTRQLDEIVKEQDNIDKNLPEEQQNTEKEKIRQKYIAKLTDILYQNIFDYIQPFIDQGFINTETKNQLIDLLSAAQGVTNQKYLQWETDNEGNADIFAENPFAERLSRLSTLKKELNNLSNTPLEKNLNQFSISIGADPVSITELHERLNALLNETAQDVTKFNIDDALYMDLENAINTMQMYRAAILAARTDSARIGDLFGYNATLNDVAEKTGEKRKLAEIDSTTADIFIADIDSNLKKLEFLKTLYNINRGQKLSRQERVSTKKDILIYKRLKSIISVLDDDELNKWEGFQALQAAVRGMTIHEQLLRDNSTSVPEDQKQEFLEQMLRAEDAIYDFFQIESNKAKLQNPEILQQLLNPTRLQLYTESKELLNEGLDNLDDNSMVWWLATRVAVKASDFYTLYRQIIDPKAEQPIAPIATQELAIYNNYASVVNGEVFSHFYKAYRQAMLSDWKSKSIDKRREIAKKINISDAFLGDEFADYALNLLPIPKYQNITLTEGIPGSGKTTAVYSVTVKLLQQTSPDILKNVYIAHGANADSAIDLRDNVGLDQSNSKTFGRETFMKEINPEWKEYQMDPFTHEYIVPKNDFVITDEKEIRSSLGIKETSTPPSLIIIDEISKFTAYDLDQIDKFARKYGITVLVAGDFDQSGVIGYHSVEIEGSSYTWRVNLDRNNLIRSPKLGVSMRTDNSLKTNNLQVLQAFMQNPTNDTIEFKYYEDDTGLYGDKVILYTLDVTRDKDDKITSLDDSSKRYFIQLISDQVDKLISTLKPKQKIGYIYKSKQSPIFQLLASAKYADYIDFKGGSSAQGLEGQYYIIEADFDSNIDNYLKDVYTGISRAQQGSIIIAPSGNDKSIVNFDSNQVSKKIDEPLPKTTIAKFADYRKKLLESAVTSGKPIVYVPRTQEEITTIINGGTTGGLGAGTNPAPPTPTYDEIKQKLLTAIEQAPDLNNANVFLQEAIKYYPNLQQDQEVINALSKFSQPNNQPQQPTDMTQDEAKQFVLDTLSKYKSFQEFTKSEDAAKVQDIIENKFKDLQNDLDIVNVLNKLQGIKEEFEIISFKNIPENLKKDLLKASEQAKTNPYTNDDFEKDDSNSDLKFGDIVKYGNDEYGVIAGINLSDSNNPAYQIIKLTTSNNTTNASGSLVSRKDIVGLVKIDQDDIISYQDPEPEILPYADNINPITGTDIVSDQDYQAAVDISTQGGELPQSTANSDEDRITIDMLLHTFNTFETGVLFDQNNYPIPVGSQTWMDARIDSVNGLVKIDKILGNPTKTKEEYVKLIGKLRNILFNTEQKSEICEELEDILNMSGIYCTFALKSTPRPGDNNKKNKREFVSDSPYTNNNGVTTTMDKGISEKTMFNGSSDIHSQEWHNKSIVAIIGNKEHGDFLELPLIALSSPFTLLQITDENNVPIFQDMYTKFKQYQKSGLTYHDITLKLINEFDEVNYHSNKYQSMVNLLKFFDFTDGAVFYIRDLQWTPFKDLVLLGPQFAADRGKYQGVPGYDYDNDSNPETEWITLDEFVNNPDKHNPQCYVTSKVLTSLRGIADAGNISVNIANAGHPFVLVSFDSTLNSDKKVIDYYVKQETDKSVPKKVKLVYVIPPKATIREYLDNLHKILSKENGVQNIGQLFTSYKLLTILLKNDTFRNVLEQKAPGLLAKVDQAVQEVSNLKTTTEQKDKLYETQDWSAEGFSSKPVALAGLFDGVLINFAYNRNTFLSLVGQQNTSSLDEDAVNLIEAILSQNGIDGVYYDVKVPKNNATTIGSFVVPIQGPNYTINGRPFRIHGKIDSYMFKGNMDWLIDYALSKLNQSGGHLQSTDSFLYRDRNSSLKQTMSSEQRAINNVLIYLKIKTGKDFSDYYKNSTLEEGNAKVVEELNSQDNDFIAFIIGTQIKISEKNDNLFGMTTLYPAGYEGPLVHDPINSNKMEDHQVNANGVYSFTLGIEKMNANNQIEEVLYDAEYDSVNQELTLTARVEEIDSNVTLSITNNNAQEYLNTGRDLLQDIFVFDKDLEDLFNVQTYDEFMDALNDYIYIGEDRINDLEGLKDNASEDQLKIIEDLIKLEKSLDPSKQDINDDSQVCPVSFKIKF